MDPFTLALATFGVQKLRGKSTKRALRDAALIGGGSFALGQATQAGMLGGSSGFLGKVGTGNPFSGIKGLIGQKAVEAKAATTNAAGEVVPAVAEQAGKGILGMDTPTKFIAASTLLPLLSGEDEGDGQMEGYRKEDYDKAYKEQSEKLEGGFEPTKNPRPTRQETYGSNMFYANEGGLATAVKYFNQGGVNYLPSKTDHDEKDYNNYVRAEGYVEDGAGNGDKDEDTMLAQLADGEFVSRADAVLGAGILSGGDPKSYKSMRKAGADFFYDQQKKLKRIYDLVDASRKDN
jgi:hypothetical protein